MKQDKNNQLNTLELQSTGKVFNTTILMILIVSLVASVLLGAYSIVTKKETSAVTSTDFYILISYALPSIALTLALFAISKKQNVNIFSFFKGKKATKKSLMATLLITFGMMFSLGYINDFIVNIAKSLGLSPSEPQLPSYSLFFVGALFVLLCVLPPILEEVIFRNVLFRNYSKYGTIGAIILSSLMFSFYHMSLSQTIYQFIVGVLYSLIILGGGNYLLTALSHFINNAFVLANYYFLQLNLPLIYEVILAVLGLGCLVFGIFLLFYKNKPKIIKTKKGVVAKGLLHSLAGVSVCILFWVVNLF